MICWNRQHCRQLGYSLAKEFFFRIFEERLLLLWQIETIERHALLLLLQAQQLEKHSRLLVRVLCWCCCRGGRTAERGRRRKEWAREIRKLFLLILRRIIVKDTVEAIHLFFCCLESTTKFSLDGTVQRRPSPCNDEWMRRKVSVFIVTLQSPVLR